MKKIWCFVLFLMLAFLEYNPGEASFNRYYLSDQHSAQHQASYTVNTFHIVASTDAQSTTGPFPPRDVDAKGAVISSPEATTLSGVPAYLWHDGCGPTAVGMVFGYWDIHGYDWLIPGDTSTQTSQVNEAISSSLGVHNHYNDYALPIDSSPIMLKDKSEPPVGDEHPDNSIADFMFTSQSFHQNYYGWSWFSDVRNSFLGYFNLVNPPGYNAVSTNLYFSGLWDAFRSEIDAGRPLVFLVDTDGNGQTDHFVTAIGYDEVDGVKKYAALNTWDQSVHWYTFDSLGLTKQWGIFGAITFRIDRLDNLIYIPVGMK
jgi:hypothetical protein